MLDVYRRNVLSRDAELHESEHVRTLKQLYSQALTYLNASPATNLTRVRIDDVPVYEFDMTLPVAESIAPGEQVTVRLGKEHKGWIERFLIPDNGKPDVIIECSSELSSLPTKEHTERYVLSKDGTLVFVAPDDNQEIPYEDLRNRVRLVKEVVRIFTK